MLVNGKIINVHNHLSDDVDNNIFISVMLRAPRVLNRFRRLVCYTTTEVFLSKIFMKPDISQTSNATNRKLLKS